MASKVHQAHPTRTHLDLWQPGHFTEEELRRALLDAGVAGETTSHDRRNVRWKIGTLVSGEARAAFGLTDLGELSRDEVLALVAREAGFDPDPLLRDEPVPIDPGLILAACRAAGDRMALAAKRGERVLLATGHPAGLPALYIAVADLLADRGAVPVTPLDGYGWREDEERRQIRYFRSVAMLTDRARTLHTHEPRAMELILDRERPDLVFADHGFAGAAIEAGVETLSIADINDPALVVAKERGRAEVVIVMDDNVLPNGYWPCFQAIASRFPPG